MAVTEISLKSNTFLTLDDVKDHLKIPLTNLDQDNRVKRLINMVTDMMEKYIEGPILTRQFVDVRDGDSSNVIVPDYHPVRSLVSLKVDYNGDFEASHAEIPAQYASIRGYADLAVGIKGHDIVVRTDANTSIVGRLFLGSTVQSIQLTYTAGHGTAETIPEDIKYAALLAIEYFYMLRENRELAVTSKSNTGQSMSRSHGLPVEVQEILDPYVDVTLGHNNRPQKNTFSM